MERLRPIHLSGRPQVPVAGETVLKIGRVIYGERRGGHVEPSKNQSRDERLRNLRLTELARLIEYRHGNKPLSESDVTLAYATFAAHHLLDPNKIAWWMGVRTPALPQTVRDRIIREVATDPRKWNARQAAGWLNLSYDERTACGIRTIGATDKSKAERQALAADRKRQRDRQRAEARRRQAGVPAKASKFKQTSEFASTSTKNHVSKRTIQRRVRERDELLICRSYVASYILSNLWSDFGTTNFQPRMRSPRLVSLKLTPLSPPMSLDLNYMMPIEERIADAYVDLMRVRMRLTDLIAEKQERVERELAGPPKRRGRKPR